MDNGHFIVSERNRPFWKLIIASLFFTIAVAVLILHVFDVQWLDENIREIGGRFNLVIYLTVIGVGFSFQKRVHIDIKKSRFRSTFEVGPIKLGQWKTIKNYEYISIFHQPLVDGNKIYEVNLWYDKNKHWELYEKYDYEEAFRVGYKTSELLNIRLLDATIPNNYKWINKKASEKSKKIVYEE